MVLHEVRDTVECGTTLSERRAWAKVGTLFVAVLRTVPSQKVTKLDTLPPPHSHSHHHQHPTRQKIKVTIMINRGDDTPKRGVAPMPAGTEQPHANVQK